MNGLPPASTEPCREEDLNPIERYIADPWQTVNNSIETYNDQQQGHRENARAHLLPEPWTKVAYLWRDEKCDPSEWTIERGLSERVGAVVLIVADGVYVSSVSALSERRPFIPWEDILSSTIPLPGAPIGHPAR